MSAAPTDEWYWDDEAGCVMAKDVADRRGGDPSEVEFAEPVVGRFAAATPDMARALLRLVEANLPTGELDADEVRVAQNMAEAALTKAGVPLPWSMT